MKRFLKPFGLALCAVVCSNLIQTQSALGAILNRSIGGTAVAGTEWSGLIASNAINANRDGNDIFHSSGSPFTWEVTMAQDYYLDRIQIFPRSGTPYLENLTIKVLDSSNNTTFTGSYLSTSTSLGNTFGAWGTTDVRNIIGKKVEVTYTGNAGNFSFAEFEVWGDTSPVPINLAAGRPVIATASVWGTDASWAADGNIDGNFSNNSVYHVDGGQSPQTWQVELDKLTKISSINIFNRSDYGGNMTTANVEILDASQAVVATYPVAFNVMDLNRARYDLTLTTAGELGKYVRLVNTAADPAANALVFAELEVFGTEVPEPSALVAAIVALVIGSASWRRRG